MKFTVKNAHDAQSYTVEIPDSVLTRPPARGEPFEVRLHPASGGDADKAQAPLALPATFLGDGESLLIGTDVVRIPMRFHEGKRDTFRFRLGGSLSPRGLQVSIVRPVEPKKSVAALGGGPLKSPMTGKVLSVNAVEGATVKEGDVLLIIEAMKMENRVVAECDGTVRSVRAKAGTAVTSGEILLSIEPAGT